MIRLRWGSATDVGMVRETNQDAMLTADPIFAVADGMGGHAGGEIASATAIEILQETFKEPTKPSLLEAVRRANAKIWDRGQIDENLHNMGTTLVAVARVDDEETGAETLAVVNVGDSRGYVMRNDELKQLTVDHSLVEEMLAAGEIDEEQAETHPRRNILTRALGVEPVIAADLFDLDPIPGDRILLCSDGLVREMTDDQVASVMRRFRNPDEAARELVAQAKANGGHDNITVVLVDVEPDQTPRPARATGAGAAATQSSQSTKAERQPREEREPRSTNAQPQRAPMSKRHKAAVTARVTMFMLAFGALVALGIGAVVWYARGTFYVGLEGEQVAIYRGRPQPVMWFKPTIAERTNVNVKDVLPNDATRLREGTVRSSLESSHQYVHALITSANDARKIKFPNAPAIGEPQFSPADGSTTSSTTSAPATTATTVTAPATKSTPEVSAAKR